jgi:hypothetical protein
MALIPCCECKRKVSEKASVCPKCGAPVGPSIEAFKKSKQDGFLGCLAIVVFVIVLAGLGALYDDGIPRFDDRHPRDSEKSEKRVNNAVSSKVKNCVLDDLDTVSTFVRLRFRVPTEWRESKTFPGEWTLSSIGAAIEFGDVAEFGRPDISVFAIGSGPDSVDRLTFKLNMNGSDEYELMRSKLIEIGNDFLSIDGIELSDELIAEINKVESGGIETPSSSNLMHRDQFEHFHVELHEERDTFTSVKLEILKPGALSY